MSFAEESTCPAGTLCAPAGPRSSRPRSRSCDVERDVSKDYPGSVNDENLVRIGLEQLQDTFAEGDALVDPVTIAIAVFCSAIGRDIDDGEMR